jgi:hypothetical protein
MITELVLVASRFYSVFAVASVFMKDCKTASILDYVVNASKKHKFLFLHYHCGNMVSIDVDALCASRDACLVEINPHNAFSLVRKEEICVTPND